MASKVCNNCLRDVIDRRDDKGRTELHYAVLNDEESLVKFLVRAGADVNAKDNSGNTPLNLFPFTYHEDDDGNAWLIGRLAFLIENGADINNKDKYGKTILHRAVKKGTIKIVKFLLKNGANINIVDNSNNTALHIVVMDDKWRDGPMIRLLLKYNPDIIKNNEGKTVLDIALDIAKEWVEEMDKEINEDDIVLMLREYIENLPQIKEPEMN
jgi:ankyrin repeat protein